MTQLVDALAPAPTPLARLHPHTALIYRSTDRGQSWELVRVFEPNESFAQRAQTDLYPIVGAVLGDGQHVALLGNANSDVQQQVWMSDDAGSTWTLNLNAADPFEDPDWLVYAPHGLLGLATHAVRVGTAIPSPQASIVG